MIPLSRNCASSIAITCAVGIDALRDLRRRIDRYGLDRSAVVARHGEQACITTVQVRLEHLHALAGDHRAPHAPHQLLRFPAEHHARHDLDPPAAELARCSFAALASHRGGGPAASYAAGHRAPPTRDPRGRRGALARCRPGVGRAAHGRRAHDRRHAPHGAGHVSSRRPRSPPIARRDAHHDGAFIATRAPRSRGGHGADLRRAACRAKRPAGGFRVKSRSRRSPRSRRRDRHAQGVRSPDGRRNRVVAPRAPAAPRLAQQPAGPSRPSSALRRSRSSSMQRRRRHFDSVHAFEQRLDDREPRRGANRIPRCRGARRAARRAMNARWRAHPTMSPVCNVGELLQPREPRRPDECHHVAGHRCDAAARSSALGHVVEDDAEAEAALRERRGCTWISPADPRTAAASCAAASPASENVMRTADSGSYASSSVRSARERSAGTALTTRSASAGAGSRSLRDPPSARATWTRSRNAVRSAERAEQIATRSVVRGTSL